MAVSKEQAQQELAKRTLASRSLEYFTKYTKPDYEMVARQWDKEIHRQIIDKLEAVERWEIKRLMIFCPPRLWKSELVSKRFPAWCLWRNPNRNIIVSSYWQDLASDFGRKTKQIVMDQTFTNIFPTFELSKDKKEWGNWETKEQWGYYSVGVWWALTGKGWDILIIDDPVKNREEAESITIQQRNIDWYTSTFYTRKQSQSSAIIVMCTRWNPNDLPWYLLKESLNGWEKWETLVIKGIDDEWEEIVWDWKWDKWYMENEKRNLSKKDWSALYQQDPINSSSNIFSLADIMYYNQSDFERSDGILKKQDLSCILSVDPAFSSSSKSDDAVIIGMWKHNISNNFYQIDWYAETSAPSKTFYAILSMYDRMKMDWYKINCIVVEDVAINKEQSKFIEDLRTFIKQNNRNIIVNTYQPKMKKEDRIKFILEPKVSLHAVYIRKDMADKSFTRKIEDQMYEFPNGKHDDVIDCLTQWVDYLDKKWNLQQKPLWIARPKF